MTKHIVCLTFDHDNISGFISRGMTTPTPISRGDFGIVATERLLELFAKYRITHAPGSSPAIRSRPIPTARAPSSTPATRSPITAGPIGVPATLSREEEEAELVRGNEAIKHAHRPQCARLSLAVMGHQPALPSSCC